MPKRTDANQREIVAALRAAGASVQSLHTIGKGCPDLLIGYRGRNILLEVKSGPYKISESQTQWWIAWRGQVRRIYTVGQALEMLNDTS